MSDKELGLLLINANYLSQQDILTSLQAYFTGVVNHLFVMVEGLFRFEMALTPPDDKITVRIGLENLIIEGSRRLREWEQLQDEIPSLDMALKFSERPGTNLRNVNMSIEEWRVVSYINPKNTMRQIAKATSRSDLEISQDCLWPPTSRSGRDGDGQRVYQCQLLLLGYQSQAPKKKNRNR